MTVFSDSVPAAAALHFRARVSNLPAVSSFQHSLAIRSQMRACARRQSAIGSRLQRGFFAFAIPYEWHSLGLYNIQAFHLRGLTQGLCEKSACFIGCLL